MDRNQPMLSELVEGLKKIFTDNLVSIILYGSVARGTNTDESDIDIAIILTNTEDKLKMDKMLDFVVDLDLKYDKVFSIVDIDSEEFNTWQKTLPFYKNVKKDGVVLWKAA